MELKKKKKNRYPLANSQIFQNLSYGIVTNCYIVDESKEEVKEF